MKRFNLYGDEWERERDAFEKQKKDDLDGAIAAEFIKAYISYIENPGLLILEG